MQETLAEEKAADQKLSAIAESGINEAATAGESEEDSEDSEADEAEEAPAQSAGKRPALCSIGELNGRRETVTLAVSADQEAGLNKSASAEKYNHNNRIAAPASAP